MSYRDRVSSHLASWDSGFENRINQARDPWSVLTKHLEPLQIMVKMLHTVNYGQQFPPSYTVISFLSVEGPTVITYNSLMAIEIEIGRFPGPRHLRLSRANSPGRECGKP